MQADYPKKLDRPEWDNVHLTYPVRKFPTTGDSSETIARRWRTQPEVLKRLKEPVEDLKEYSRDFNITKELTSSQTTEDYAFKLPLTKRHNKHTSCVENEYIYPQNRRIEDRVPQCTAHGTTEMRDKYPPPTVPARLVTDKNQYKLNTTLYVNPLPEPSWHKELEPLDTTHDGFEKYLDPYLTTNQLHHRPFTADQLANPSNSKDIVTYYTYANVPWAWGPKPKIGEWNLPPSRAKKVYDREKFQREFRDIITHNKLNWVPKTFRTESRDNYTNQVLRPESKIRNFEEDVRSQYLRITAGLDTNEVEENSTILAKYTTEARQIGSGKPLCSVLDQHVERNKRLENKNRMVR